MTLYDLQQMKKKYESMRHVLLDRASMGLVSKIELMEFDIKHLNEFADGVSQYLAALEGDSK